MKKYKSHGKAVEVTLNSKEDFCLVSVQGFGLWVFVMPRFVLPAFNVGFPQATLSGLQGEYNQMAGVIGEATNILIVGGGAVGVELAGIGGAPDLY